MPTATRTFAFASDLEGMTKRQGASGSTITWDASNGSPTAGSADVTDTDSGTHSLIFDSAGSVTWETWGVPAGSSVTDVTITGWKYRPWGTGNVTSCTAKMRIVDSANASVHSAGDVISQALSLTTGAWITGGAATSRAVDAGKQASTTAVKFELQLDNVMAGVSSFDYAFDTIAIQMTYSDAGIAKTGVGILGP